MNHTEYFRSPSSPDMSKPKGAAGAVLGVTSGSAGVLIRPAYATIGIRQRDPRGAVHVDGLDVAEVDSVAVASRGLQPPAHTACVPLQRDECCTVRVDRRDAGEIDPVAVPSLLLVAPAYLVGLM